MTTSPDSSRTHPTAPDRQVDRPVAPRLVDGAAVLADLSESVIERAAMYLAGALDEVERQTADAALRSAALGDAPFRAAVAALQDSALALGEGAAACFPSGRAVTPDEIPSPAVRARLLDVVTGRPHRLAGADESPRGDGSAHASDHVWRGWSSDELATGLFTLRRDETGWERTGVDGVLVRRLFVDGPNNRMTAMFRMAPGTEYPEHIHNGYEECYVLEGELHVGEEIVMHAGDYQRADGGSEHARQWTERGCVLLVSTSMSDKWS